QHKTLSEKENQASSYALPLVGNEQHSSHADKTQLAQNRIDAVQQLHVLSAASLAGFEVIMYGRFCPDHRGFQTYPESLTHCARIPRALAPKQSSNVIP